MQHSHPFDPTGGYAAEDLVAAPVAPLPAEPADFVDFWRANYVEALSAPLDWTITPAAPLSEISAADQEKWEVFDISFAGMAGPHRIGGWLIRPKNRPVRRGFVFGHGYGGRGAPQFNLPADDAAAIFPVCTGQPSRSPHPSIPPAGADHVLSGIESRETYSHRFCVMDIWRAASVLLAAVPETAARLDYIGGSFGGGIGALALAWDARFTSGHLEVPSFGHHPLRFGLPCCGSGESVRHHVVTHPEAKAVLAYFDSAVAASHIRIPMHVAAAVFDPAVPPAGQFAVYHAIPGPKTLFTLAAGHHEFPGQAAQGAALERGLRAFFQA